MAKQIHQLTTASSVGASDYLAKDTGSVTNKVTISQIANFVVGTYTTLVAGATQTIKAAINAVKSQLTTLQNHTGLTSISGSGKSTISELLGNTSISSIGNGTVTGALSSLNNNLANIGDTATDYLSSTMSIPNATATGVASISLSAGTWVVVGKVTYQGGAANTYRLVILGTSAGGNQYGWTQFLGISGFNCSAVNVRIITLTAKTTVHLSAQHNSGAAINVAGGANNTFIQAVRIA